MRITVSFLKSKMDSKSTIKAIEATDADYIHVDVMDGKFVDRETLSIDECLELLGETHRSLDVHLMVEKPLQYIEALAHLPISFLTIHVELGEYVDGLIERIHELGIRAGLAINPETNIDELNPYLERIDYIIVMGVNPGYGGQELIPSTIDKVSKLKHLRDDNCYHYLICLDGGVNLDTRKLLDDADVLVSGSFICMSDNYQKAIDELR